MATAPSDKIRVTKTIILIIIIIIIISNNNNNHHRCHWKVEKGIQSYLQKIPGKHNLYNLQRSAILGTAHILRKVLSIKPDSLTAQNNRPCES